VVGEATPGTTASVHIPRAPPTCLPIPRVPGRTGGSRTSALGRGIRARGGGLGRGVRWGGGGGRGGRAAVAFEVAHAREVGEFGLAFQEAAGSDGGAEALHGSAGELAGEVLGSCFGDAQELEVADGGKRDGSPSSDHDGDGAVSFHHPEAGAQAGK
jgi:hypothetical protein